MRSGSLVVIPAFNEAESIGGVLKELSTVRPDLDVIVVDDGSTDGTAAIARTHGVPVAVLPFNLGVGGALRTGLNYATREGYERVIQVDADGQHDPYEIQTLLDGLDSGADMVVGSRFARAGADYRVGAVRSKAMRVLRLVVRLLSGKNFTDTSSGFRAFGPEALRLFVSTYPAEYLTDTVEALLLACYEGLEVVEVPCRMRARAAGRPSTRNVRLLYHYLRVMIILISTASFRARSKARAR